MRRWIIALAVSVGLNLFFLGVTAGRFWQHQKWRSRSDAVEQGVAVPGARRTEGRAGGRRGRRDPLSWMNEAERSELRPQRQALVQLRRDAERVLTSDPFEAAKFRGALQAVRTQTAQIQSSVHERLAERAQALGPEERRKLAEVSWGTPGERSRRRD